MGGILVLAGAVLVLLGWIMILIAAFKESILWGLGSLFIHLIAWIFVITHWQEAKSGFMLYLAGFAAIIVGAIIGGQFKAAPF